MRKIIVFVCTVLLVYFLFLRKNSEQQVSKSPQTAAPAKSIQTTASVSRNAVTEDNIEIKNSSPGITATSNKAGFNPLTNRQSELSPKNPIPAANTKGPSDNRITNEITIAEIDPSYTPPEFLMGTSAIIAKYVHIREVLKDVAFSDIKATYARGVPVSKFISENLRLPGNRHISVHFDDWERKYLTMEMSLTVDYTTVPLQGMLSIKLDPEKTEKSCDAAKIGPLKSLKMLPEDNTVILIKACDESFYIQAYFHGKGDLVGNFYERAAGEDTFKRTGEALLSWKFDD